MAALPARPPYQLLRGDRYNIALGMVLISTLAATKDAERLPRFVRWQLNAFTNWNLLLIALGKALGQAQWDPFLCANSMGILLGFRTAMAQNISEQLRKKIRTYGLHLSWSSFAIADHAVHTAPVLYLVATLVRSGRRVTLTHVMYSLILGTWFAFRQGAKLDSSSNYVPHPWRRAWLGIVVGSSGAPFLVDALIDRKAWRTAAVLLGLTVPWLTTRLDADLKKKYAFEFAVAEVGRPKPKRSVRGSPKNGIHRIESEL